MPAVPPPKLSVVVVSHNSAADLAESLPGMLEPGIEVIVVDNDSADGSSDRAAAVDGVVVTALPVNIGWARGCNVGAGQSNAPVLAFVNPDARPTGDQLLQLAQLLDDPRTGSVSPRFVGGDAGSQAFYFRFPSLWTGVFCVFNAGQHLDALIGQPFIRHRTYDFGRAVPTQVDQPGAACMVVRATDFRELGGFDEDMFLFFADTDLCQRLAQTGRRAAVDWTVDVFHAGGGSVRQLPDDLVRQHFQRDYLQYVRRHHGPAAVAFMKVMAVLLTGVLPAALRLLRGRPREAWGQLRLAGAVVR